ncbi:MAG: hypothetical protein ABSG05_00825 [Candidatus Pacearchaeota archaeon]|jgi:hypothetical protein
MTDFPRIITGLVLLFFGLYICFVYFSQLIVLIFGIIVAIIGIVILLNKKENKIEEVRKR